MIQDSGQGSLTSGPVHHYGESGLFLSLWGATEAAGGFKLNAAYPLLFKHLPWMFNGEESVVENE